MRRLALALGGLACGLAAAPPAWAQALPATIVEIDRPSSVQQFPVVDVGGTEDPADDRSGTTAWRIVPKTGNCCEQYLMATSGGRLLDHGGSYVNYTDDRGLTWKSVRTQTPLVNGEGAISGAPDGDIVAVSWDLYSGDHLVSFRYAAAADAWEYLEMPLHTPFYDREWIASIPGGFAPLGDSVRYVSFVRGGVVFGKEPWLYSRDGLTYHEVSSPSLDAPRAEPFEGPLPVEGTPESDWMQPTSNVGIVPLGNGWALAAPDASDDWAVLDPEEFVWRPYRPAGGGVLRGRFVVDSRGRLHNAVVSDGALDYGISTDGGAAWSRVNVPLPSGATVEEWDFRANAAAGVAAVAMHVEDRSSGRDSDHVYKLSISGSRPALTRRYQVGRADFDATSGLGNEVRFDFATVAILPDGRVAISTLDSTTKADSLTRGEVNGPALAIEEDTALPAAAGVPPQVSLRATARAVTHGAEVRLEGEIARGGVPAEGLLLRLERSAGGPFKPLADVTSGLGGRFSYVVEPRRNSRYRAVVAGADAAPMVAIGVRPVLTLRARRRGGRVLLSGSVRPAHPRHRVRLQARRGSRWSTVATARIGRRSTFAATVRAARGTRLRAVLAAHGDHLAGSAATRAR